MRATSPSASPLPPSPGRGRDSRRGAGPARPGGVLVTAAAVLVTALLAGGGQAGAATTTGVPTTSGAPTTSASPRATSSTPTPTSSTTTTRTTPTSTAPTARLLVSASADRSSPAALEGRRLTGNGYVFVDPGPVPASKVEFWVDATSTTPAPYSVDSASPWDLAGTAASGARAFDTRVLANGGHTVLARVTSGTTTQTVRASFTVDNPVRTAPSTTPTSTPRATVSCAVSTAVWQGGYVLNLTVRNEGPSPISAWSVRLAFTQDPRISNSWNAAYTTSGLLVTGANQPGNGSLKVGDALGIGLQGSWTGTWTTPACTASGTPASLDTTPRTSCDNGASLPVGKYWALNNLWGASTGTGRQCITARSAGADALAWSTTWQWAGQNQRVKSYSAAILGWHWGYPVAGSGLPLRVDQITAVPARWQYDLSLDLSGPQQVNVAYDVWTGTTTNPGSPADEIMVWNYRTNGIQPVGTRQTTVRIGGIDWEVWKGAHTWNVMTYVRTNPQPDDDLTLDLKLFFDDLVARGWLARTKYVVGIEAGSEVFIGNGDLRTTFYQVGVR